MERKSSLIFTYTTFLLLKMRLASREEGNSLMKGDVHGINSLLSREMIMLVSLLIQSISKKDTFKSLEF